MKLHLSRPLRLSSHTAPTFRPTPICGTVTSAPLLSSAPMSSSKAMSVTSRAPSHALLRSSDRGTLKITMVTVSPNSNPLAKRPGLSSPPFLKRAGISLTRLIRSHSARRSCHNLSISAPPLPSPSNRNTVKKIPPPVPPRPSKEQLERSKHHNAGKSNKGKTSLPSTKSFAQVASSAANILEIKEAFPALPNKRIIEIHNAAFDKPSIKTNQITTKGPSRKQAIVPLFDKHAEAIMTDAGSHVHLINNLLKNIKSNTHAEYIRPCPGSISIVTNSVPAPSDLTSIE